MTKQWLAHVKKMIHLHPGQSFSLILKKANKTYKKSGVANKKRNQEKKIRQKIKQEVKKIRKKKRKR